MPGRRKRGGKRTETNTLNESQIHHCFANFFVNRFCKIKPEESAISLN
jgi:hypothetical protein